MPLPDAIVAVVLSGPFVLMIPTHMICASGHRPRDIPLGPPPQTGTQMPMEFLFSYGTLQLDAVQMATFGRRLTGTRDVLPGFETTRLEIDDQATISLSGKTHHAIAKFTGRPSDSVSGTVFAVTRDEIQSADKYEVAAYKRVPVLLRSGVQAWAYVDARYPPSNS